MFDASYRYCVELAGNRSASDNLYRVRKRARNECGERIGTMLASGVDDAARRRVGSVHFRAMPWAESNAAAKFHGRRSCVPVDRAARLRQHGRRRDNVNEWKMSAASIARKPVRSH
jgi:hypothetical protein